MIDRNKVLALLAKAKTRAAVFDDGSDGADAESARSAFALIAQAEALAAKAPEKTARDLLADHFASEGNHWAASRIRAGDSFPMSTDAAIQVFARGEVKVGAQGGEVACPCCGAPCSVGSQTIYPFPNKKGGSAEVETYTYHPAPKPAEGEGPELYYLQDSRSYVGNCPLWWGPDRQGYVTRLDHAGKYTREEAMRQHASRATDKPWLCSEIDKILRPTVDMQELRRLTSPDFAAAPKKGEGNG